MNLAQKFRNDFQNDSDKHIRALCKLSDGQIYRLREMILSGEADEIRTGDERVAAYHASR